MQAKRFEGATMKEALEKIRTELGPDAVILDARQSHGRGMGWLLSVLGIKRRVVFQVVAAADTLADPVSYDFKAELNRSRLAAAAAGGEADDSARIAPLPDAAAEVAASSAVASEAMPEQASAEQASAGRQAADQAPAAEQATAPRPTLSFPEWPPGTMRVIAREAQTRARVVELPALCVNLCHRLEAEDVSESLAISIAELIASKPDRPTESGAFLEWAGVSCAAMLEMAGPVQISRDKCKVVAFTGPTGVGKTTTIAKIAAGFAIYNRAKVAMVTADTYRIAAIEQIQTYGLIMGVPVEVVHSPRDMKQAVDSLKDYQLVLIDTAGRNPNNPSTMYELKNMLEAASPDETHLVVSATTRRQDLDNLIERFAVAGFDRVVVSKVDESNTVGAVFNAFAKSRKPFSYFANGQNVPDDIKAATQHDVAQMLLAKWRNAGGL